MSFILPGRCETMNLNSCKPVQVVWKVFAVLALFQFLGGCHSFYKVTSLPQFQPGTLISLQQMNKVFVFHSEFAAMVMKNITVGSDSVTGEFAGPYVYPSTGNNFPAPNSSNMYRKKKGDSRILNEVHVYIMDIMKTRLPGVTRYAGGIKDIYRVDVYDPDKARTVLSWVLGAIGGYFAAGLAIGILGIIGLAIGGNSCPYVYVNQGDHFGFAGEIYSGAVYASLERNDYLYLPGLVEENGKYLLKIANALDEEQHTNLAELLIVDHPDNSQVLFDKYGNCQTASLIRPPLSATTLSGTDILKVVCCKDSICYCGNNTADQIPLTDGIMMTFDVPREVDSCKLFLRARNSIWLDYVFTKYHGMLGVYQGAWTKKQDNSDPGKFNAWALDQKIPLTVYVQNNGKWKYCDYFNMAGPMALKEDVLKLDLKGIKDRPLTIKLEAGTCFWEIDYAGLDYSPGFHPGITTVAVENACTEDQVNVSELLNHDDSKYYVQPEKDNVALLSFPVPPVKDAERTLILHSKGFYHINGKSDGIPKVARLNKIRKPGQFTLFSRDLLQSAMNDLKRKSEICSVMDANGGK
jgi:hypothetical protein